VVAHPVGVDGLVFARELRERGRLIGSNDLWIAAAALEKDWILVTRNTTQFARIPDLKLRSY